MIEKVITTRICRITGKPFDITEADVAMLRKLDPIIAGRKFELPLPTVSPEGRHMRRVAFRNERKLYKGTSSLSGRSFLSMYRPDSPHVIYEQKEYWGDAWNPMDFGRDFDFSRPFFEQFSELHQIVPRPNLLTTGTENAEYTNYVSYLRDSYLVFDATECEDTYYGYNLVNTRSCMDLMISRESEHCYELIDCYRMYDVLYGYLSEDCTDCFYVADCKNCTHCIGCVGLENASYYIYNKSVSESDFKSFKKNWYKLRKDIIAKFDELCSVHTFLPKQRLCEGCDDSGGLVSSKNAHFCFDSAGVEDSRYIRNGENVKDSMDVESCAGPISRAYELNAAMDGDSIYFSMGSWGHDIYYSDLCTGSNLFGCIGLHSNESYCIFNKQYSREAYESLVPRIIEHMMRSREWGEFFPPKLSPFGYNETIACDYYPLTKQEILKNDIFNWSDYETPFPKVAKILKADIIPDDITKIPDDVLNWAIECEVSGKPFRIIKQELEFYRKHNLPIPKHHPEQRHLDRLAKRKKYL